MTASEGENYLAIVRGEQGVIRQIWNTWDGLADVLPLEGGGYAISIYPPAQVMEPEEEGALFTVEGTPAKIFTVTGDEALQTLVISCTRLRDQMDMVARSLEHGGRNRRRCR